MARWAQEAGGQPQSARGPAGGKAPVRLSTWPSSPQRYMLPLKKLSQTKCAIQITAGAGGRGSPPEGGIKVHQKDRQNSATQWKRWGWGVGAGERLHFHNGVTPKAKL